jgi:soluble lytic murein transglycosylase-like protein
VAARESLGVVPRAIAPARALPGAGGPAWLREAELLVWLGETDDAATLVERAIDWQASARADASIAGMGFTQGSHWLRAARIAYLADRPHVGIRLAHRPRWRMLHDLPADVDREAVLPWMYPPAYDSLYAAYAPREGIEPALLSAIGWQESFFEEKAVSRAGALGVMQFMPATARLVARRMGEPEPSAADLLEAERSIRLGADYFAGLLRQFGGAVPPALAAYNAGPGRARTWIRRANGDGGALFCEVIGFDETINYVKNILGAWQAYRWMGPRWE